jgi:hypothetical protein
MLSSIKAKIVIFYMAVLFVILSVLGIFLYFSLGKIVYDSIDSGLLSRAKALATLVNNDSAETEFNFSDEVMWEYNSPKSKNFFQIRRFDGTTLEKSASLKDMELKAANVRLPKVLPHLGVNIVSKKKLQLYRQNP